MIKCFSTSVNISEQQYHWSASLHQYCKIPKREDTEPVEEPEAVSKRPFYVIYSLVKELDTPKDSMSSTTGRNKIY